MKYFIVLIFCFYTALVYGQGTYELIVATNFDGEVVSGSIDSLIKEIRAGKPVRVGWQLDFNKDKEPDFDHWISAEFITILNGHVFTQIDPIFAQLPNITIPQVEIFVSPDQWTAVIGTNGKLLNRFITEPPAKEQTLTKEQEEAIKAMQQVTTWEVATFWSVQR